MALSQNHSVYLKARYNSLTSSYGTDGGFAYGYRTSYDSSDGHCFILNGVPSAYFTYGTPQNSNIGSIWQEKDLTICNTQQSGYIKYTNSNGEKQTITIRSAYSGNGFTTSGTAYLFALNTPNGDVRRINGRIYEYKVVDETSGEIVQHLLPYLDNDGVPCMYDIVRKKAHYNIGEKQFGYQLSDDKLISTMYFASDVRSAEMTHALWRGNISFEIGGVSYVHGVNMQIADDGMSVAFTGEDKPTRGAVVEALGEASNLSMILNANQLDVGVGPENRIDELTWEYVADVPIAPCSVGASLKASRHGKKYYVNIYTNSVSTETHVFNYEWAAPSGGGNYEDWANFSAFGPFGSKMIVRWIRTNGISSVYWIVVRFSAFTYTREFNVTSIE